MQRVPQLGYGRELFLEFVPPSARDRIGDLGVPVLSGAVVAEVAGDMQGPMLEVTFPGAAALAGLLRAVRFCDAVLAVRAPPPGADGMSQDAVAAEVIRCAAQADFDRPLVLVAGAPDLNSLDDSGIDRAAEAQYDLIHAGFTSIAFAPGAIAVDPVERVTQAAAPLVELGLGVELDFGPNAPTAALLAEFEETGLPIAAVRGSRPGDPLCGGLPVFNPLRDALNLDEPSRVLLDPFLLKAVVRALPGEEAEHMLEDAADDIGDALFRHGAFLDSLDARTSIRLEAMTYGTIVTACERLGAAGVASDLLDGLAREYFRDALT